MLSTSTRVAMSTLGSYQLCYFVHCIALYLYTWGKKLKHAKEKDVAGRIVNSQAISKQLHSHTHSTAAVAHN